MLLKGVQGWRFAILAQQLGEERVAPARARHKELQSKISPFHALVATATESFSRSMGMLLGPTEATEAECLEGALGLVRSAEALKEAEERFGTWASEDERAVFKIWRWQVLGMTAFIG